MIDFNLTKSVSKALTEIAYKTYNNIITSKNQYKNNQFIEFFLKII